MAARVTRVDTRAIRLVRAMRLDWVGELLLRLLERSRLLFYYSD
jgi:hypothetical protein